MSSERGASSPAGSASRKYTVYSQAGMLQSGSDVLTGVSRRRGWRGPRYRPWAGIAESSIMEADAKIRAQWEMAHRSGEAVRGPPVGAGMARPRGLVEINQQALCNVPRLTLKQTYLIGSVDLVEDREGGIPNFWWRRPRLSRRGI